MNEHKKHKLAIAIRYESNYNAPKVLAKGKGKTAEKIIEEGQNSGIKIHNDEKLASDLINIDIGKEIPEELYNAVASVLAFIYKLDSEKGD